MVPFHTRILQAKIRKTGVIVRLRPCGQLCAFTNPDGVLGAPRGIDLDAGNTLARLEWLQASTAEYSVKSFAKDADNTISAHIGVCG